MACSCSRAQIQPGKVTFAIRIAADADAKLDIEDSSAHPYRRIFASYSHKDERLVREFRDYAVVLGDEFVRDWTHLRVGERWDERLLEMIEKADVFQLFWSHNAMRSEYVRREYEHALALGRAHFVRPTYWEDLLPADDERGLPPAELRALHFSRLPLRDHEAAVPTPRKRERREHAAPPAKSAPPARSSRVGIRLIAIVLFVVAVAMAWLLIR